MQRRHSGGSIPGDGPAPSHECRDAVPIPEVGRTTSACHGAPKQSAAVERQVTDEDGTRVSHFVIEREPAERQRTVLAP